MTGIFRCRKGALLLLVVLFSREEFTVGEDTDEAFGEYSTDIPDYAFRCQNGVSNGLTCCAASCGTCGGDGCRLRSGGTDRCCAGTIQTNGTLCTSPQDVACVMYEVPTSYSFNVFMYDLEVDPLETTNVVDDSSYQDIKTELFEQMAYFQGSVREPVVPPEVDTSVWAEAGGVIPYAENEPNIEYDDDLVLDDGVYFSYSYGGGRPNFMFILLDDVGSNDGGFSIAGHNDSWISHTTPNMDYLVTKGVRLTNYYTAWLCGPTRSAFLTGRYSARLGFQTTPDTFEASLPLEERLLPQELSTYGYVSYIVGKWHLGFDTWSYTPTFRGFDAWYGYYSGSVGFWNKLTGLNSTAVNASGAWYDLQWFEGRNGGLVEDEDEAKSIHLTTLLQSKAEEYLSAHTETYADSPFFMYYAAENVHVGDDYGFEAPLYWMNQCQFVGDDPHGGYQSNQQKAYCALMLMIDDAIADTVCLLDHLGFQNTLIVVGSDNGGWKNMTGNNAPYRGSKGSLTQGGVHNFGFILGPQSLIPTWRHNQTYHGLVHITDWFPTFLNLASQGNWTGPKNGYEIDGVDVLNAIAQDTASPRKQIFHNYDQARQKAAMQIGNVKMIFGRVGRFRVPPVIFAPNETVGVTNCSAFAEEFDAIDDGDDRDRDRDREDDRDRGDDDRDRGDDDRGRGDDDRDRGDDDRDGGDDDRDRGDDDRGGGGRNGRRLSDQEDFETPTSKVDCGLWNVLMDWVGIESMGCGWSK